MTFLQPFVLWGLPLILLPVIIHLLNRLRHRPQPWAAMQFLVSATRSSVSNARLRQWLILALRVLAVLMLILFVARPLAGGWLGWALSPAPDVVLVLLDRSASMETTVPGTGLAKRTQAIQSLVNAAKPFEESTHLVLIDSATRIPQEVGRAETLRNLPAAGPSDTSADMPGLFAAALNYLVENRPGTAELWVASDLQRSNWQPEDPRWSSLLTQLQALPQRVRVRLLALNQPGALNRSIALKEMIRRPRGDRSELQFALDIQSGTRDRETLPLTANLDGARTQSELTLEGQGLRWRHTYPIGDRAGGGWGSFELPPDGNGRDNTAYFVYGPEAALRATIVCSDSSSARLVQLALSAGSRNGSSITTILSPTSLGRNPWESDTLLVWMEPLPTGAVAQRIRGFVEEGGTVLFLPPSRADAQRFEGLAWGEVQSTAPDRSFRVLRWNEEEGPLAKSDEGLSLPLVDTQFHRREVIIGPKNVLAAFDDGVPLLARQNLGRGELFFCATLPDRDWSTLGDGPVLVPMMQRLLISGSRRLQQALSVECGQLSAVDQSRTWESLDSPKPKDIRVQAGVYRSGDRLLAVNRPKAEDDPDILDGTDAERLLSVVGVQMLEEKRRLSDKLQGEIWRVFLVTMLLCLIGEGLLILPPKAAPMAGQLGRRRTSAGPVAEGAS